MNPKLKNAIAHIYGADEKTRQSKEALGTGFLITKKLALTALHVLMDRDEGEFHYKYFWMIAGSYEIEIRPLKYDLEQDWAIVECLTNTEDYKIKPLEISITPVEDSPWKTFGWPRLQPLDGMTLQGVISDPLSKLKGINAISLLCSQALGNNVNLEGLSGSPILYEDKAFGIAIFQLIGGTNDNPSVSGGTFYARPIECIYDKEQLPEIPLPKFIDVDTHLKYQSWLDELKRKPGKALSASRGFIETFLIEKIYRKCVERPGIVCVIGAMGTGKSTIAGYVAEEYLKNNKGGTVIILPLSPSFYKNQTPEIIEKRIKQFIKALKLASKRKHHRTLFIIEDLHESVSSTTNSIWSDDSEFTLDNCSVLITTRSENYEDQLSRLQRLSNPPVFALEYTDPNSTAKLIIDYEIDNFNHAEPDSVREALSKLYFSGRNLVYLDAIIKGWKKSRKKSVQGLPTMNDAYQAIFEELRRVSNNAGHEDVTHMSSLLLLWMLGGVEISVEENFLSSQFNLQSQIDFWDALVDQNEIRYSDETDELLSLRHPAWGTLTILAIDNLSNSLFRQFREAIVYGFRTSIQSRFTSVGNTLPDEVANKLSNNTKPSICLFAAIMIEDINDADYLNRYCSGKSIHDEFIEAVTLVEMVLGELAPDDLKSSERLISSSDSIRRCSGEDPEQRQQLIEEGHNQLVLAIQKRENYFLTTEERDLKRGFYLYNHGYYLYLKGMLNEAKLAFLESVNAELVASITGNSERQKFAAMSSVMLGRVLLAMNDITASLLANRDAEVALGSIDSFVGQRSLFYRFQANINHVFFEIALATSEYDAARQRIEQITQNVLDAGMEPINDLYLARLALAEGDGLTAKKLAMNTMNSVQYKTSSETLISIHRVLGDIYLFLGESNQALHYYQQVLPDLALTPRYLSPELLMIHTRVQQIQEGRPIEEILVKF